MLGGTKTSKATALVDVPSTIIGLEHIEPYACPAEIISTEFTQHLDGTLSDTMSRPGDHDPAKLHARAIRIERQNQETDKLLALANRLVEDRWFWNSSLCVWRVYGMMKSLASPCSISRIVRSSSTLESRSKSFSIPLMNEIHIASSWLTRMQGRGSSPYAPFRALTSCFMEAVLCRPSLSVSSLSHRAALAQRIPQRCRQDPLPSIS